MGVKKWLITLDLGVGASVKEIKESYRDLCKVWHPDRFSNNPRLKMKAEEKLKDINLSYKHLLAHLADANADVLDTVDDDEEEDFGKHRDGKVSSRHSNGKKKYEYNLKNGQLDGLAYTWYESGQLKSETEYQQGKRHGACRTFNNDGQQVEECTYANDQLEGLRTAWYENGQKEEESEWHDGKPNGVSTFWNEAGLKESVATYKDGELDGVRTQWNEEGVIDCVSNWRAGRRHGPTTYVYPDGAKKVEIDFLMDVKIARSEFFKNGNKKLETCYKNGKQDGLRIQWFEDGTIESKVNWQQGVRHGTAIHFHRNGNRRSESTYLNGLKEGGRLQWYENGAKASQSNWRNNLQHGVTTLWYEDGTMAESLVYNDGKLVTNDQE